MLYIWKHRKQERLGQERKRLDLCSRLLCARHPPSAAGPALAGPRLRAGAGLYHGDGDGAGSARAPARRACSGTGFNLLNRGFSWPFMFFCQVGSGRGLAVSTKVRSGETSSSRVMEGRMEGRMELSCNLCTRRWGAPPGFVWAGLGHPSPGEQAGDVGHHSQSRRDALKRLDAHADPVGHGAGWGSGGEGGGVQRCAALFKLFFKGACSRWSWDVAQGTPGTRETVTAEPANVPP